MENNMAKTQDYQIKNGTITVESVYTNGKTIKELLKEYLIQGKDLYILKH